MIIRNSTYAPVMKTRLSIEEIRSRTIGEPFEIVSTEYINAHQKLDWKCLNCKNIFHSSWLNISFGWGCPICKGIKASSTIKEMRKNRGDGMSKTEAENLLSKRGLEFLETPPEYISNLGEVMKFRCLVCDFVFGGRIQDLKKKTGYGCWDCSRPRGDKHIFWRGGKKEYPKEWTKRLREEIRNRDNRTCQFPDCSYSDAQNGKSLHVHHINGIKSNCTHRNLISLCHKHHNFVERNRSRDWEDYFYSITKDYEL